MRDEREQFAGTKISHETLIPYTQSRKPIKSKEDRKREKASFRSYRVDGGGDAS